MTISVITVMSERRKLFLDSTQKAKVLPSGKLATQSHIFNRVNRGVINYF